MSSQWPASASSIALSTTSNTMMQARAIGGIADVHAGTFTDGFEALQNLDGIGIVGGGVAFLRVVRV